MGKKLRQKTVFDSPIAARLILLREEVWSDDQPRMASDLGCSVPNLSNILAGRQSLSIKVLQCLSERAEVDVNWILTGDGTGPCRLPLFRSLDNVAQAISTGSIRTQARETFGVCQGEYRPTRLAYVTGPRDVVETLTADVRAGDVLVFDTDAEIWIRKPSSVKPRPCILQADTENGGAPALGLATGSYKLRRAFAGAVSLGRRSQQTVKRSRGLNLNLDLDLGAERAEPRIDAAPEYLWEHVRAVCTQLIRRFD